MPHVKLVEKFPPIFNLHPAPPNGPKGTYIDVIWNFIQARSEYAGAMMHLVTPKLDDSSEVICFDRYPIIGKGFDDLWKNMDARPETIEEIKKAERITNPLWLAIREKGMEREVPLLVEAARLLASHKVNVRSGELYDSNGRRMAEGIDMTKTIDRNIVE